MKFISYLRVSTQRQGASGLGLEAQRVAVTNHLNQISGQLVGEFVEIESGKKDDRAKLLEALATCRVHNATLIIAKLDRLSRNVAFISNLMESGVEFVACDFPQANRLTVHILAAVAEHEREMISQRTKAALQAAKARGVKLGGDRGNIHLYSVSGGAMSAEVRRVIANKRAFDLKPVVENIRQCGKTSLRQIAAEMNNRDIRAPRGGEWSASQVRQLLNRIKAA